MESMHFEIAAEPDSPAHPVETHYIELEVELWPAN